MHDVVVTCCILHNMIIDCQDSSHCDGTVPDDPMILLSNKPNGLSESIFDRFKGVADVECHHRLMKDLVEHRWNLFGNV